MKKKEHNLRRKRSTNRHLSEQYVYTGENNTPTSIRLIQYNANSIRNKEVVYNKETQSTLKDKSTINWLQVSGLTDFELVTRIVVDFGLDALDAKDILTPQHVVKIEEYRGKILVILNSCHYDKDDVIQTEHIGIILTENTIVTFTENDHTIFQPIEKAIQDDVLDICSKGDSSMLLAFLLNAVTVSLVEASLRVEEFLEDIEDTLLDISTDQSSVGSLIQQRRREYMVIRKNGQPLREQINKLTKENSLINHDAIPAFIDIVDQLQYVNQTLEGCREIISSLVDLYISNNDLRMNAIMKRLTIVSTLFIPLTFLAGIWGMNFEVMPETKWQYGYLIAWGIMIAVGIITWLFLRKKDWY
ncbi:magnesium/cobalt transporter CorA [Massilibacteroides sp.]|uniref:magnesium/cobalt transporter CorA n=1 Tax=Massilibacteroides sp. TaxID=2034766 RepID=UPI002639F3FC|nr:magnesium/cobalt transporter CorA [Massilibacteroides sp.]MDD4514620.1 magnesium/cobalt transporter CorA [Massilibacteroides sp.]